MKIINQSSEFSKIKYNTDFDKYKTYFIYIISEGCDNIKLSELLSLIHDMQYYNQLEDFCIAVRNSIFGEVRYKNIHYRMTNISYIQKYQRTHGGELPNLSCLKNCLRIIKMEQHPYQYDYYGGKPSDIDLLIRTILNLNVRSTMGSRSTNLSRLATSSSLTNKIKQSRTISYLHVLSNPEEPSASYSRVSPHIIKNKIYPEEIPSKSEESPSGI